MSQMRFTISMAVLIAALVLVPVATALAHSPVFPEDNDSLATAYQIDDPAKSWATYAALDHADRSDYYRFTMSSGDRITISLLTPESPSNSGFLPLFALLVPGLAQNNSVAAYIEVPDGYGTIVVNGTDPGRATYEPFSPGWYYELASLTMNAAEDGTYYVVVFDSAHKTGNYGLPVGYVEEFTPMELIMIPYNVHVVYVWEGQNQFVTLLPIILTLVIGGIILYWRSRRGLAQKGVSKWLAAFAGLAFLGSAASIIYQMLLALSVTGVTGEAAFTLVFVAISLVLGVLTLMYAVREKPSLTPWRRAVLIVIGVVALFTWSGLYLGPALAISAGLVPPYEAKKK